MPFRVGLPELIIILVIVLVIFGAGRIPQIGSSLGRGIRAFKQGISGKDEAEQDAKNLAAKSDDKK